MVAVRRAAAIVAIAVVAAVPLAVTMSGPFATMVFAASPGFTACPDVRPATTGELHLSESGDTTYSGFALESKATLCVYAPAAVMDVTVVGWNGTVTIPGVAQQSVPPGVHYYVLLGIDPDGHTLAYTEKIVGAAVTESAPTDTPIPGPSGVSTPTPSPLPTVTLVASGGGSSGSNATVEHASVAHAATAPAGASDEDGSLALTGGALALLAARVGIALLAAGFVVIVLTRRRGGATRL